MQLKDIVKFTFLFLSRVLVENPFKFLIIITTIVCYSYAGTVPDVKHKTPIIDSIVVKNSIGDDHLYITSHVSESEVKYSILENVDEGKIINGIYHYSSYSGLNVLLWVIFVIGCILLVIGLFMCGGDGGWDISENWCDTIELMVICEEENGKYYYTCFSRLLDVTDSPLGSHHSFYIKGFNRLNRLPKWHSKQNKRERLLSKLDI